MEYPQNWYNLISYLGTLKLEKSSRGVILDLVKDLVEDEIDAAYAIGFDDGYLNEYEDSEDSGE